MSAPSSGSSKVHAVEQQEIIDTGFGWPFGWINISLPDGSVTKQPVWIHSACVMALPYAQ